MANVEGSPTANANVEPYQASMSVGTQAVQANSRQQEAAEASSPTEAADKELEGLAITSSIAELGYALENVSTLIFEIQVRSATCNSGWCNAFERQ